MNDAVWIEILSGHRQVLGRHRLTGTRIRIGRGYDNDLVLDDPYVAETHLILDRDENGRWWAEDQGSVNGLLPESGKVRQSRLELDGERPIRIGRTLLRVRDPGHPVPAERPLGDDRSSWLAAGLGLLLTFALVLVLGWQRQTTEPEASQMMMTVLYYGIGIGIWAGIWSLLGRLFAGRAGFDANLVKATLGILALTLWREIADVLAFVFSSPVLSTDAYFGSLVLGGVVIFWQLQAISPARPKLKAGILAALVVLPILVGVLGQREALDHDGAPLQIGRVYPPIVAILPRHDPETFFGAAARLQAEIDTARLADQSRNGSD